MEVGKKNFNKMTDLTIVIISFNTRQLTVNCLKSIFEKEWKYKVDVCLVDNNSYDDSVKKVKELFPKTKILESNKNLGFTGGNNIAFKKINSKYVLLLNSDTIVTPYALDNLMDFIEEENLDIASCKLIDDKGRFQANAGELPALTPLLLWLSGLDDILGKFICVNSYQALNKCYYKHGRNVGWVSGSAMLVKKEVFKKIGFLDENIFMYGEDVEFCLRAKIAGLKIGWTDRAEIIHLGGGSSNYPKLNQWRGEFKGLLYIYKKYYGLSAAIFLRLLFYIFITLRALAFLFLGKFSYTKTYAKVIFSI